MKMPLPKEAAFFLYRKSGERRISKLQGFSRTGKTPHTTQAIANRFRFAIRSPDVHGKLPLDKDLTDRKMKCQLAPKDHYIFAGTSIPISASDSVSDRRAASATSIKTARFTASGSEIIL